MSRIAEQLQKLHRPAAPMGFGFAAASVERRRMMLIVRVDEMTDDAVVAAALAASDAVVALPEVTTCAAVVQTAGAKRSSIPVGLSVLPASALPAEATTAECDFVVCDVDGPADAVTCKGKGCLIVVDPSMEASRLRALADVGADAIVLSATTLDLTRLSALVECRRAHILSGKPVLLHVDGAVSASQVVALWRAGVDGLLADISLGGEVLAAMRGTIDGAPFQARPGVGGGAPVIGTHVGALNFSESEDNGGGEEDDDDDE